MQVNATSIAVILFLRFRDDGDVAAAVQRTKDVNVNSGEKSSNWQSKYIDNGAKRKFA